MPATRSGTKSAAAFRTISEVADELEVPQHVLRFWETKFGQIRPLKRGGGRRYYRPEDIDLLRGIRDLLYGEGYTIKGVQRLLREGRGKIRVERQSGDREPEGTPSSTRKIKVLEELVDELSELRDILRKTIS
jgi:DNA-binding transcriptional MerR regulator